MPVRVTSQCNPIESSEEFAALLSKVEVTVVPDKVDHEHWSLGPSIFIHSFVGEMGHQNFFINMVFEFSCDQVAEQITKKVIVKRPGSDWEMAVSFTFKQQEGMPDHLILEVKVPQEGSYTLSM